MSVSTLQDGTSIRPMLTEANQPIPEPTITGSVLDSDPAASEASTEPWPNLTESHLMAELKGQAQFLLYLVDQIEDSLGPFRKAEQTDQGAFLARLLMMYANQLEQKQQSFGQRIGEMCQEIYLQTRGYDL